MNIRVIASLTLLAAVAVPASALDIDVRLTAGSAAQMDEIDYGSQGGTVDLDKDGGASGSLTAHVFVGGGLIGFMAGGGFKAAVHGGDQDASPQFGGDDVDITYTGKGLLLEAGLTIHPLPLWRIEVRPQITVGKGKLEVDVPGTNIKGASGDYQVYGGVVGNYVRLGIFEAGLDLGFESMHGESEIEDVNVECSGKGFIAQISLGLIF